jgi:Bacterial regulatory protein, Fis family/Sigma-54 interaction domain
MHSPRAAEASGAHDHAESDVSTADPGCSPRFIRPQSFATFLRRHQRCGAQAHAGGRNRRSPSAARNHRREPGVGKQTFAQLLYSRSNFARSAFNRCDAREWLLTEVDPQFLTGFSYLDRVDLLAAPGQDLLLRVLKSLQDRRDGTFALVASSERSLRDMASVGQYLPDLAFRLTSVRFAIPPLRDRREDIAPLAASLLERISARYRLRRLCLAPGATARLLQHDWPANARELSSVLESAVISSPDGVIRGEDLTLVPPLSSAQRVISRSLQVLNLDAVILNHIRLVLDLNRGNKLKTARQLGISRSTLYRLLQADSPSLD